jgi:hypothetical protein
MEQNESSTLTLTLGESEPDSRNFSSTQNLFLFIIQGRWNVNDATVGLGTGQFMLTRCQGEIKYKTVKSFLSNSVFLLAKSIKQLEKCKS